MLCTKRALIPLATVIAFSAMSSACSKRAAEPQAKAEPITFKTQAVIPVILTLLKAEGESGRTSPISSNYRPQVRFPLGSLEASCTVQLPVAAPSLEPGQSSSASLICDTEVRVERSKPEFTVIEGGKPVGNGSVQLP
jgi:translation elongation factor EF-Tu-like GTPase